MAGNGTAGSGRHVGPGDGLLQFVRRLIDALADLVITWILGPATGTVIPATPPCPGPMAYYIVPDACDLAECQACGYIAIAGTIYDPQHVDTPHKEGLAT